MMNVYLYDKARNYVWTVKHHLTGLPFHVVHAGKRYHSVVTQESFTAYGCGGVLAYEE